MSEIKEQNGVIESTTLSTADHGVLSSFIFVNYGGRSQGFGGYLLYGPRVKDKAGLFIWRVLEIAGVSEWSKLIGRPIRVRSNHVGIEAIGHFIKDDWFYPRNELEAI